MAINTHRICFVVAVAQNGVIGFKNKLPWDLPDDLKHFRALTEGQAVIMGRKTYESIGKLLPNRTNIIVTQQKNYAVQDAIIVHDLKEALEKVPEAQRSCIIGGAQIFKLSLAWVETIYLTEILGNPEGDCFFPEWPLKGWEILEEKFHPQDERHAYPFRFLTLRALKNQTP